MGPICPLAAPLSMTNETRVENIDILTCGIGGDEMLQLYFALFTEQTRQRVLRPANLVGIAQMNYSYYIAKINPEKTSSKMNMFEQFYQ